MPSRPFTADEDQQIRELVASGAAPVAIAKAIKRAESSVYRRINTLGLGAHQKPRTQRACMCCRIEFWSEGPHNRLCGRCRTKDVGPF